MKNPRVLFAGTPEFALASLESLVDAGYEPNAVLTQPDRRAGRGRKVHASPVKQFAVSRGIPVLQPTTLRTAQARESIAAMRPDIMIVAAYGLLLPREILDIPTHGCLNVHASLLPRWRGAAPIQAAILAGDGRTGISLMSMTVGLDCGPVFATAATDIGERETAGELLGRLAELGGRLLVDRLDAILSGELEARPQDESHATYAGKISTSDARLDWSLPAAELSRRVRAYNPVPGAWFMRAGERIKCWRASLAGDGGNGAAGSGRRPPGSVLDVSKEGVVVACGDASLVMETLQRPGGRRMAAAQFPAARALKGTTLD